MAIAARVVGDPAVAAILAALDMAPEGSRAAVLDSRHHLELAEAHTPGIGSAPSAPHGDESRPRPPASGGSPPPGETRCLGSSRERDPSRSSGLITARMVVLATRV